MHPAVITYGWREIPIDATWTREKLLGGLVDAVSGSASIRRIAEAVGRGLMHLAEMSPAQYCVAMASQKEVTEAPAISAGTCLFPLIREGDQMIAEPGTKIATGDVATFVARGMLLPMTKVFIGVVERDGQSRALFWQCCPATIIEVVHADILHAEKIGAVSRGGQDMKISGAKLLGQAGELVERIMGMTIDVPLPCTDLVTGWGTSLETVIERLRQLPTVVHPQDAKSKAAPLS